MREYPIDQWVYVAAPLFFYGIVVLGLAAMGDADGERNLVKAFFRSISNSLRRLTGLPGWSVAGALTGLMAAGIAMVGLYWDVAWHIDLGRDEQLFTPSHTMILLGLNGLVFAAGVAVVFATLEGSRAGFRFGGLQVPWTALVMGALGLGAVAAFPLDNLWHQAYGIDVTLWSPTHLQLVAGGSLGPMAMWLMLREGRRADGDALEVTVFGRGVEVLCLGAILTGLSTFQGEFDFGVPQFQALYHPLLIVAAAGIALVAARLAVGAGGAVMAVLVFLGLRLLVVGLVSGALNHTIPRFPLYLVPALAVEAVAFALGTQRRLRYAAVAGAAIATVGLAAELAWVDLSGWGPLSGNGLLPALGLGLVAAVAAAVIGAGLGQGGDDDTQPPVPAAALGGAALALLAVLALPLPRTVGEVDAVISLARTGDEAVVTVRLDPPDAAEQATLFGVVAWQGGGRESAEFERIGDGVYRATSAVPVTGSWKTMIGLQRGSQVMAAPVYLPADPEIGAASVAALDERSTAFTRNTDILLREQTDGPAWPALASYLGVAVVAGTWIALLALAVWRIRSTPPAARPVPAPPAAPAARGGWVPRHVGV